MSTRPRELGREIWRWVLLALAGAWIALVAASYQAGLHEAEEITDAHLAAAVNVLLQVSAFGAHPQPADMAEAAAEQGFQSYVPLGKRLDLTRSLAVVVWDNGRIVADSRPADERWPINAVNGYSTFSATASPSGKMRHWRMFVAQRDGGAQRAAAMVTVEQRQRLGRIVGLTIARPAVLVLPLVALLLWWAIRRGLRPLHTLSERVAGLNLGSGARLEGVERFAEFQSVVGAINGLIERLRAQLEHERAFAADVAHEMRSPLAAITLQAQIAAQSSDTADRADALRRLGQEALRAGRVLAELLELARAQRPDGAEFGLVSLGAVAERSLAVFGQASHDSGHQLELMEPTPDVRVQGNAVLLDLAIGNLVANALRHTPRGTVVRIEVGGAPDGAAWIEVSDDGARPGAEDDGPAEGGGLGWGLRLVERIAGLHRARLVRAPGRAPMTTSFSLRWDARAV